MKITILDEAEQDLVDGYRFYEAHGAGLGDYFLDCCGDRHKLLQIYSRGAR